MAPKKKALPKPSPKPKAEAKAEAKAEVKAEEEPKAEDVAMADAAPEEAAGEAAPAGQEEKPKEPERPKEAEADAPPDSRPKVKAGSVAVNMADTTLNVMPTAGGKLLMTLTEGGLQYLLAGARANVGVKSGRYMFEVKIVENLNTSDPSGVSKSAPLPKNLVKVGFSLAGSSLIADGQDSVSFDSEGRFISGRMKKKASVKFVRGQTVGVLMNLDAASPNKNTISLFRNGLRVSEPQPLPESLCGKALYPTVTYRNVSVQLNLGPTAVCPLPFQCRMLGDAAAADVEVAKLAEPTGSCEVLVPVGLPEAGFFDWVDFFREKNPGYTELSDRMMLEWAMKSGIFRQKAQLGNSERSGVDSNDRPEMRLGIPPLDSRIAQKILLTVSPMLKRNFIVPELQGNLLAEHRQVLLAKFGVQGFKKKAVVVMGKPPAEYKTRVQERILANKRAKAEAERRKKEQEETRKRLFEEKKRKAEEARKAKMAESKKRKEGDEETAEGEEVKEEEVKEEEKEEVKEEKVEEAPVELTEEEKGLTFRKQDLPDMTEKALAKYFTSFSMPGKDEGFDEVAYAWDDAAACTEVLKAWVLEKKLTQRAEDLTPGDWFAAELSAWNKTLSSWRRRCGEWKDPVRRKALIAQRRGGAKKKEEGEKEGAEEFNPEEAAPPAAEEEPMEIDHDNLDVFAVEDIMDLGNGEPLFANFLYEDWTLLSTRFELHLLLHAFKKDLNDPDRPSFTEKHLEFYYSKYFKKPFTLKNFGVENLDECVSEFIRDTLYINDQSGFLVAVLAEDTPVENFVKLTEEHRRERQRRIDAGDETAKLKFSRPAPQPPRGGPNNRGAKGGAKGGGKGKGKGNLPAPSQSRGGYGGGAAGPRHGGGYLPPPPPILGTKRPWQQPPSRGGPPPYGAPPGYGPLPSKLPRTGGYGGPSYGGQPPYGGYPRR